MDLRIFWTDHAKAELLNIYQYYKDNVSLRVAKNETKKIAKATI
jgi:plasmid stabilization system protein ParE